MNPQAQQRPVMETMHGGGIRRGVRHDDRHGDFHDVGCGASAQGQVVEKPLARNRKPRMFKVVLLNDDYTPMEFVVRVLQRFFRFGHAEANRLMLEIHRLGRGVCGTFSREIAETKAASVNRHSRARKHPLLCVIEPDDDAE